jgi:hypothetical protein
LNIKHVIVVLSLILLLAVIILLPNVIENIEGDKSFSSLDSIKPQRVIVQTCRLNDGACLYSSSYFGDVLVEVSPKEFPAFKPLSVFVALASPLVKSISVSFQGKDMFMGPNSVSLNKTLQGVWSGDTMIPVCSVDPNMVWLVQLTLIGEESEQLVFEVKSGEVESAH